MIKRWYVWAGLGIYALILITTFIDALEVFNLFAPEGANWSAIGVAIGFDLLVLYYSILSVIKPSRETRLASYLGGALLWFIILSSMIDLWNLIDNPHIEGKIVVGFILSLFIPLGSFLLGRVIGASIRYDDKENYEKGGEDTENIPSFLLNLPDDIREKAIRLYFENQEKEKGGKR